MVKNSRNSSNKENNLETNLLLTTGCNKKENLQDYFSDVGILRKRRLIGIWWTTQREHKNKVRHQCLAKAARFYDCLTVLCRTVRAKGENSAGQCWPVVPTEKWSTVRLIGQVRCDPTE